MKVSDLVRNTFARAVGLGEFAALATVGRLADRFGAVYQLDAYLSARRLRTLLGRQDAADRADPDSLRWSERSHFSQNGEDGVIEEIFRRIGSSNKQFVEIGASDGLENCTRNLVEGGWSGTWIEADHRKLAKAIAVAPSIKVIGARAKRDTVALLLQEIGVPANVDLLVIDIDSDDLGVLRAAIPVLRPRVVVVEYNAAFTHRASWAMAAREPRGWDGTFRHGASLRALEAIAAGSGYSLVHCDQTGVNAFFVCCDVAPMFPTAGLRRHVWRVASFTSHPFGHPRSRRALAPMAPMDVEHLRAVTIDGVVKLQHHGTPSDIVEVMVTVRNSSPRWLTSGQPNGFHVSLRWRENGSPRPPDASRTSLPRPVAPGATVKLRLWTRRLAQPGRHHLRVTVLCEGVFWREDLGGAGAFADLEI